MTLTVLFLRLEMPVGAILFFIKANDAKFITSFPTGLYNVQFLLSYICCPIFIPVY